MSKTLAGALRFFPKYPHNNETGRGWNCDVRKGMFCSVCGAGPSIAWIVRNMSEVENPYNAAKMIYDKWDEEDWYGADNDRPYIQAMLSELLQFQNNQRK
jgi:hypothetical protein